MSGEMALIARAYTAYNGRDVDTLLELVDDAVDWPDGDTRMIGKPALRRYWLEQWARVHTHDEPVEFRRVRGDLVRVDVRQVVRSLEGRVISQGGFTHHFRVDDGRISRLDIDERPIGSVPRAR